MSEKTILVTNDDGITSKGIACLVAVMKHFGRVVVVAPSSPQSAKGHGISINDPLRMKKVSVFGSDVEAYESSGTPADCIKMAKAILFKDKEPDLVVSGVNHGSNAAVNIVYSGTVSGAMEAGLEGIPAVAFSLLNWSHDADFSMCEPFINQIVQEAMSGGIPKYSIWNVNIPNLPAEQIKGIEVCRQAHSKWVEKFDQREDPYGQSYYWLTGKFVNLDDGQDTDEYYLGQGYVTIVPVHSDHTAYEHIDKLKSRWKC